LASRRIDDRPAIELPHQRTPIPREARRQARRNNSPIAVCSTHPSQSLCRLSVGYRVCCCVEASSRSPFLLSLIVTFKMSTRQAVRSLRQITNGRPFSTVVDDRMAMAAGSSSLPRSGNVLQDAMRQTGPRHDWSKDEIREIYKTPLMELAHQAVGTRAV
jgi:hypothetical protein